MPDEDDERPAQRHRRGAWVPSFESTDAEATEAFLTATYDMPIRINNVGNDYRFRLARLGSGPLHFVTIDHTPSTDTYSDPLPEYLVVVIVDSGTRTNVDVNDRLGPGDFSLYSQPGQAVHFHAASIQQTMVMVPMQAARDAVSNRPADDLGALHFDSMRPTQPAAGRHWLRTVAYVTDNLLAFPDTMAQPLLSGAASRLLAATLLTTFPNSWITEPQHHDPDSGHRLHRSQCQPRHQRRRHRARLPRHRPRRSTRLPPPPQHHPDDVPAARPTTERPRTASRRPPQRWHHHHRHRRPLGIRRPQPIRRPLPPYVRSTTT